MVIGPCLTNYIFFIIQGCYDGGNGDDGDNVRDDDDDDGDDAKPPSGGEQELLVIRMANTASPLHTGKDKKDLMDTCPGSRRRRERGGCHTTYLCKQQTNNPRGGV